ncbi:MAG: hypothetical protein D6712_01695 [Chloroflexi bacterium]|nr:MAG: hypothetical protein D6712_01695 [Chloroflexota bacterium]
MEKRWYVFYLSLAMMTWACVFIWGVRGFDFTDNGFYLLTLRDYQNISIDSRWFGALVGYLYDFSGGALAPLRLSGISIMLFSSLGTSYMVLRRTNALSPPYLFTALAGGTLYYSWWLTTPSYNWLVIVGFCWFLIGALILTESSSQQRQFIGGLLLGCGITAVAWGKLTSAAVMVSLSLSLWLVYRRRFPLMRTWLVGVLIGVGLVAGLGLLREPYLTAGLEKLQLASQHQFLLRADEGLFFTRFIRAPLVGLLRITVEVLVILSPALLILIILLIWRFRVPSRRHTRIWHWGVNAVLLIGMALSLLQVHHFHDVGRWVLSLYALWLLIALIEKTLSRRHTIMVGGLFMLSLATSYGTNNIYIIHASLSAFFLLLAVVILISLRKQPLFLALLGLSVLAVMIISARQPYRQAAPLWEMQTPVEIQHDGSGDIVLLDEATAAYLQTLQEAARANGFASRTPIIDLSGRSPGVIYALDGTSYGFMWLLGGYTGSLEATRFVLEHWPANTLQAAWVITSNGDRSIPSSILADVGLSFPQGYTPIIEVTSPIFNEQHTLWRRDRE